MLLKYYFSLQILKIAYSCQKRTKVSVQSVWAGSIRSGLCSRKHLIRTHRVMHFCSCVRIIQSALCKYAKVWSITHTPITCKLHLIIWREQRRLWTQCSTCETHLNLSSKTGWKDGWSAHERVKYHPFSPHSRSYRKHTGLYYKHIWSSQTPETVQSNSHTMNPFLKPVMMCLTLISIVSLQKLFILS